MSIRVNPLALRAIQYTHYTELRNVHYCRATELFSSNVLLCGPPRLTFSNSTFCPHSVFMCFVWIWEQTAIISPYTINWVVCITETECVYCAVRTGSLYTASLTFSHSTFCPHSVFMCFVWIWEQTAIISLYSINWLVCITETECVYCAVRTGSLYRIRFYFCLEWWKICVCWSIWTRKALRPARLLSFSAIFLSLTAYYQSVYKSHTVLHTSQPVHYSLSYLAQ